MLYSERHMKSSHVQRSTRKAYIYAHPLKLMGLCKSFKGTAVSKGERTLTTVEWGFV